MASEDELTWFPTKVDWWLGLLMGILPLSVLASALAAIVSGKGAAAALVGVGILVGIYGGLVFPMRYGIGGGQLVVRHGLVRQRCKLSEIVEVYPTRNPLSSPALSLDRLMISKGTGFFDSVMISPADREGFLALLAEKAGLVWRGEKLVRVRETPG